MAGRSLIVGTFTLLSGIIGAVYLMADDPAASDKRAQARANHEQGNYRGKLSANPYDPDSTSNPYGRYGSPFSPDSIKNPYGAGNPYSPSSPTNPYGRGLQIEGR